MIGVAVKRVNAAEVGAAEVGGELEVNKNGIKD
jgi:hypothetical protein